MKLSDKLLIGIVLIPFIGIVYGLYTHTPSASNGSLPHYYFSYMYATSNASGFSSGVFDGLREELEAGELVNVKHQLMKQNSNYVNVEIMFVKEVKGK